MEEILITKVEYEKLLYIAEKWNKLDAAISEYYETYDDDGNEIAPEKEGDLCDIGEKAALAFGYM